MLGLSKEEKDSGVATVSSGNHGSSVSYAAKLLGIKKCRDHRSKKHTTEQNR